MGCEGGDAAVKGGGGGGVRGGGEGGGAGHIQDVGGHRGEEVRGGPAEQQAHAAGPGQRRLGRPRHTGCYLQLPRHPGPHQGAPYLDQHLPLCSGVTTTSSGATVPAALLHLPVSRLSPTSSRTTLPPALHTTASPNQLPSAAYASRLGGGSIFRKGWGTEGVTTCAYTTLLYQGVG